MSTDVQNFMSEDIRLLYVEDDAISAKLVQRKLQRSTNIQVDLAENGKEGLAKIASKQYDIMLLDNDMPQLGGVELMQELESREIYLPVIMITGAGDEITAVNALRAGCRDYIIKDSDGSFLHLLPAVISQVLRQERADQMLEAKNRENQRLLEELKETNTRLERINDLKNEVMEIATHDLRSPLTAIIMAAEAMESHEMDEAAREMLEVCQNSSQQALNLIDSLLNASCLDSGELPILCERANFSNLTLEVVRTQHTAASRKQIKIDVQCEDEVIGMVDTFRFRELVDNLLSNAIKYSEPGSTVTVRTYYHDHRPSISVKDHGPGFTDEDRRNLYKRFQRLSAKPTANEPSSGIGLSIIKRITELHDADIELISSPGKGAEFIVSFPSNKNSEQVLDAAS